MRTASEQFYAALNRMRIGDAALPADIRSQCASVTTMHPINGLQVGWDKVREPWEQVARLASEGQGKLGDQIIEVAGDVAYELGVEHGQFKLGGQQVTIGQRVTNINRPEAGGWKIVHHHTDVSSAMMDVVSTHGRSLVRAKIHVK